MSEMVSTGTVRELDAEAYHAIEALSYSAAKHLLRSPQHYRLSRSVRMEPTPAMRFGTAVHLALLEPDAYRKQLAVLPGFDMMSRAGRQERDGWLQQHAGRLIVTHKERFAIDQAVDAVMRHPAASWLLDGGEPELSLFWRDGQYDVPCKARYDKFNRGGVVDLKTTVDAGPVPFGRAAAQFMYHAQAAHYLSAGEHALGATPEFFAFVVVESAPPYGVACYHLPSAAVLAGAHLMNIAMQRYAAAMKSEHWIGYPDTIQELPFPQWALKFDA